MSEYASFTDAKSSPGSEAVAGTSSGFCGDPFVFLHIRKKKRSSKGTVGDKYLEEADDKGIRLTKHHTNSSNKRSIVVRSSSIVD